MSLREFGAVPPYLPAKEGSWAFVGYKGKEKVNWITQECREKGNGPSEVLVNVPIVTNFIDTQRESANKEITSIGK